MAKKAIQDRILPEAPAPVRSAPKPKAAAPVKNRGAGPLYVKGDYSRRKGDLLGLRDVQREFGPRPKQTANKKYTSSVGPFNRGPVPGGQGTVGLTNTRFTPTAKAPKATVGGVYSDVNARMMAHNKKLAAEAAARKKPAAPAAAPTKSGGSFGQAFAAARKAGQSTFSFGGKSYTTAMKGETRPAAAKKAAGTRIATGGGNKGGKVSASSARPGVAATRARAFGSKNDVAGPRKDSSGRNVSSASGKRK